MSILFAWSEYIIVIHRHYCEAIIHPNGYFLAVPFIKKGRDNDSPTTSSPSPRILWEVARTPHVTGRRDASPSPGA